MQPAITQRHSHVCILDPKGADVDHGYLYDVAPDEDWAVEVRSEVRFRSGRRWIVLLD